MNHLVLSKAVVCQYLAPNASVASDRLFCVTLPSALALSGVPPVYFIILACILKQH